MTKEQYLNFAIDYEIKKNKSDKIIIEHQKQIVKAQKVLIDYVTDKYLPNELKEIPK